MNIQHRQSDKKGMFFVAEDTKILAELVYRLPSPDKMIIDHTEVNDVLRGKNVGYQLIHTAIEYARANNIKIVPQCPFAASVFKKKPEFADVLFVAQ